MSKKNWDQLVEEDAEFHDDFDESMLDEIQEQFHKDSRANSIGESSSAWEEQQDQEDHPLNSAPEEEEARSGRQEEFLDFEEFSESLEQDDGGREIELDPSFQEGPSKEGVEGEGENQPVPPPPPRVHRKKVIVMAALGLCILLGGGGILALLSPFSGKDEGPVTRIRQPVPLYFFSEKQEYFFLARSEEISEFLILELQLTFEGQGARKFLERGEIQLRDHIYRFLMEQQTSGNTFSQWQSVLENSLVRTIKEEMPESNLQKLSITNLERV